ncbi:MAG: N-acetylglucosaminyltransferase [Chitinophagaceae bacterium]|nr:N-acetylglucosaminyltransferase [Chitinophagaceae bacterium]
MNLPDETWLALFILFCLVILVQLFYQLYFFRRLAFYQPKQKTQSQEYPVSVIICGRDEAHNLARNLPGILVQDYKSTHEVIVINDNSTDESKYLLDEFRKSFKNLVAVPLTQEAKMIPGKKFPLSIGIKTAKYEIVLLTDADCVPASEHWMKKMQDGFAAGTEIVLGYGAYHKLPGLLNKLIRFETFHTALLYLSYALAGKTYMGVGRNLAYKKDLFFKNKGFSSINHTPGGDDDLFINKVATKTNTSIVIDYEAHTLSDPKKRWSDWINQKFRHYTTAKYYKPAHKRSLGLYTITHALLYPLLIICSLFFNWWLTISLFLIRLVVQGFIYKKAMNKLNENDLWPLFIFFDIWMFIYYFVFAPALWKKPKKTWN